MCRARPTDKQRLVELLQKDGQIVAVTGDGTNDAPALNHANVRNFCYGNRYFRRKRSQ